MNTRLFVCRSLSIPLRRDAHGCYQEQPPAGCEVKAKQVWGFCQCLSGGEAGLKCPAKVACRL